MAALEGDTTSTAGASKPIAGEVSDPGIARLWPRDARTSLALAALLITQAGALFWATRESYFFTDDYLHFWLAQERSLPHYLATPILGTYPAPGHRLTTYLLHAVFPLNYDVARIILIAMLAMGTVALAQVVRTCARSDEWWTSALVAPFALSLTLVPAVGWWSTGPHVMGLAFFTAVAFLAWLRSYGSSRPRFWIAVTVVALFAAGSFHSKFLLVPFYLLLFRLLILPRTFGLGNGLGALWGERYRWSAVFLPAATYVAVLVMFNVAGNGVQPAYHSYLQFVGVAWFQVGVPVTLLNMYPPWAEGPAGSWAVVAVGQVALIIVLAATIRRTRLALRAWSFFLLTFLLNALMLASFRLQAFGTEIAYLLRYYPEVAYLLPVLLALCFRQGHERHAGVAWEQRRIGRAVMAMHAGALAFFLVLGGPQLVKETDGALARPWMTNLLDDLASAQESTDTVSLLDAETPEPVMAEWMFPQNRIATVVALTDADVEFNELSDDLLMVADDGRLVQPELETVSVLLLRDELAEGVSGGTRDPAGRRCLDGGTLEYQPSSTIAGTRLAVRIDYAGDSSGHGVLTVVSRDPDEPVRTLHLEPEHRAAELLDVGTTQLRSLRIEAAEGRDLCMHRVEIVSVHERNS
jgi:hypothetical protein